MNVDYTMQPDPNLIQKGETFQIVLWTHGGAVLNNSDISRVSWQVNWDSLFNGRTRDKQYKARVYLRLRSNRIAQQSTVDDATGYLYALGLPSPNSYSPDAQGTFIAPINFAQASGVSSQTGYYWETTTAQNIATPTVILPSGIQILTLLALGENGAALPGLPTNYQVSLVFETL